MVQGGSAEVFFIAKLIKIIYNKWRKAVFRMDGSKDAGRDTPTFVARRGLYGLSYHVHGYTGD